MNRRIQGRVKHAQKRAKVRADIRAGRRISMQAFVNGSAAHNHEVEETTVLTQEPAIITATPDATHVLVYKGDVDLSTGKPAESEVARGTEYAMRKQRASMGLSASNYAVRKLK